MSEARGLFGLSVLLPDVWRVPSGGRGLSNVLPSTEFDYPKVFGYQIRLLQEYIGMLSESEMARVDKALAISVSLNILKGTN